MYFWCDALKTLIKQAPKNLNNIQQINLSRGLCARNNCTSLFCDFHIHILSLHRGFYLCFLVVLFIGSVVSPSPWPLILSLLVFGFLVNFTCVLHQVSPYSFVTYIIQSAPLEHSYGLSSPSTLVNRYILPESCYDLSHSLTACLCP